MARASVLLVCMGNICRSPTAHGVLRDLLAREGLGDEVVVDSAGTHAYHVGEAPDERAQLAAARRGYDLSALRARRVRIEDFERFDYILAMDRSNLGELRRMCPPEHAAKLRLFLDYTGTPGAEVPDPYFGGASGFEQVLDLVEAASRGLISTLRARDGGQ